jgi:hypothetical protein
LFTTLTEFSEDVKTAAGTLITTVTPTPSWLFTLTLTEAWGEALENDEVLSIKCIQPRPDEIA